MIGRCNPTFDFGGYSTIRVEQGPQGSVQDIAVPWVERAVRLERDRYPRGKHSETNSCHNIVGESLRGRRVDLADVHTEYVLSKK